jgi:formate hydrogenlyase transcriptional activator
MSKRRARPKAARPNHRAAQDKPAKAAGLPRQAPSRRALAPRGQSAVTAGDQYLALLEVSESIAAHRDLEALFHDLAQRLHRVVHYEFLTLVLYDPKREIMRLHILESAIPTQLEAGLEFAVEESPAGWSLQTQAPVIIGNIEREQRFPKVLNILRAHNVKSICSLPLTTAQRPVGALGFGSAKANAYAASDLEFLTQAANQVAVAVDNALNTQSLESHQRQLAQERDRLRALLDITNAIVSNLDVDDLRVAIGRALRRVVECDYAGVAVLDEESHTLQVYSVHQRDGGALSPPFSAPLEGTPAGQSIKEREPALMDLSQPPLAQNALWPKQFAETLLRLRSVESAASGCSLPLIGRSRPLGALVLARARGPAFTQKDLDFLGQAASQIAIPMENALQYRQIAALKEKLAEEKLYLEDEIRTDYNFEEIIGESAALTRVLRDVETVAPTDSTVLILGETGTGKELIARAIHNLSRRRERAFVKLNCAAIPSGLLESELFGHERGAFTGALTQKLGRFELASGGTLFLDEVGDIPLDLQPKLLRVLQEQEFERLGGIRTIRADVRLVAATNRNLSEWVQAGGFRSDLYYRLSVFPLTVPPLRERPEDIPLLVRYFAQKYARQMDRRIETIPAEVLDELVRYPWPGNVRELENLIERAVILSPGPVLRLPLAELKQPALTALDPVGTPQTLEELERQHILRTLHETHWVVAGPHGAARRLGLKRSTLQSRMYKLGIVRR